jgi:iron complex transport system substrate-binding protein
MQLPAHSADRVAFRCAPVRIAFRGWRKASLRRSFTRRRGEDPEQAEVIDVELDDITGTIVDAAVRIHREVGPGLFESLYEALLASELARRGLRAERQRLISCSYNGDAVEDAFRADLLVEAQVIIEVKSLERLAPVHMKQLLTYLRLTNLRVGLLLNFGAETMKEGMKRVVNDYKAPSSSLLRIYPSR